MLQHFRKVTLVYTWCNFLWIRIQEICLALIESIDNFSQLLGEAFERKGLIKFKSHLNLTNFLNIKLKIYLDLNSKLSSNFWLTTWSFNRWIGPKNDSMQYSLNKNLIIYLTKYSLKHRKNCECCPVSQLIVRSQTLSWIQVLNYQNCSQCLKCHKSLGLLLGVKSRPTN